jgi:hypothetical protein
MLENITFRMMSRVLRNPRELGYRWEEMCQQSSIERRTNRKRWSLSTANQFADLRNIAGGLKGSRVNTRYMLSEPLMRTGIPRKT